MLAATPVSSDPQPTPAETGRRAYELFCLAALLVMLVVLMERDYYLWSLIPCLIGIGGIAGRWSLAVPMLLITLVFVLLDFGAIRGYRGVDSESDLLSDLLLSAAVLAYASAQYRLQGLARQMTPPDPRLPRKVRKAATCRRPLGDNELFLLVIALPCFAWLATEVWSYWFSLARWLAMRLPNFLAELPRQKQALEMPTSVWRLLVLLWFLGLAVVLWNLGLAFCTWRQRGRTPEEAVLFLQDLFWRETRAEQRSVFRWLTWTRLRHERRKEPS